MIGYLRDKHNHFLVKKRVIIMNIILTHICFTNMFEYIQGVIINRLKLVDVWVRDNAASIINQEKICKLS